MLATPLLPLGRGILGITRKKTGAPGRNRTCYQGFRKPLLYPMSYERKEAENEWFTEYLKKNFASHT